MCQPKGLTALKKLIRERNDTQGTLAEALGMHRTTFNAKLNERGDHAFTEGDMEAISEHYHIPLEERQAVFFENYRAPR